MTIKPQMRASVNPPTLKLPSFDSVDQFLKLNPLPGKLRHLEPALRKLPTVGMVFPTIIEQLVSAAGEVGK